MRIFDCCLLNKELELLELRMEYLDPIVDYFVVTQSFETFSGQNKPLYLSGDLPPSFKKFEKKIVTSLVPTWRGEQTDFQGATAQGWERFMREALSRNTMTQMVDLLARAGDTVLMSDVDEIPNRDLVVQYAECKGVAVSHHQKFYRYYLNTWTGTTYPCTIQTRWPLAIRPQEMRNMRFQWPSALGGWHFSTLYDTTQKLMDFSHAEYDTPYWHQRLAENKAALREPFDRGGETYTIERIDKSFPDPVWQNKNKYQEWIYQ